MHTKHVNFQHLLIYQEKALILDNCSPSRYTSGPFQWTFWRSVDGPSVSQMSTFLWHFNSFRSSVSLVKVVLPFGCQPILPKLRWLVLQHFQVFPKFCSQAPPEGYFFELLSMFCDFWVPWGGPSLPKIAQKWRTSVVLNALCAPLAARCTPGWLRGANMCPKSIRND